MLPSTVAYYGIIVRSRFYTSLVHLAWGKTTTEYKHKLYGNGKILMNNMLTFDLERLIGTILWMAEKLKVQSRKAVHRLISYVRTSVVGQGDKPAHFHYPAVMG